MKNLLIVTTLALFGALSAFSAPVAKPLIVKSSGGGHMMPEFGGGETCEVYADRVVITHTFGFSGPTATKLVETRKITLQGNIAAIINLAKEEKEETKPNFMCDGPYTSISANPAVGETVGLFSTGACGSPRRSRDGMASSKLKNIVNLYCPLTYDNAAE